MHWSEIERDFDSSALAKADAARLRECIDHLRITPYGEQPKIKQVRTWLDARLAELNAEEEQRTAHQHHNQTLQHDDKLDKEAIAHADQLHAENSRKTNLSLAISAFSLLVSFYACLPAKSPSPLPQTPAVPAQTPPSRAAQPGPPSPTPTNAAPSDATPLAPPEGAPAGATNAAANPPRE